MNYVKIGSKYINLDNVTSIEPVNAEYAGEAGIIQINFAGQPDNERSTWLEADAAQAFTEWLDIRAVDILGSYKRIPA